MFLRSKLACSFCGKRAAEVSKLVAGPRVFICDTCVAEANRIMNDPTFAVIESVRAHSPLWRRLLKSLRNPHRVAVAARSLALHGRSSHAGSGQHGRPIGSASRRPGSPVTLIR
jgi:ATP-dependent Clp protease ATP-binding subunit ClpX